MSNPNPIRPSRRISPMRRQYILRLVFRCAVLAAGLLLWLCAPGAFDILSGWNFFAAPSLWHVLWAIWVVSMLAQLIPFPHGVPLGSQKLFKRRFVPAEHWDVQALRAYLRGKNRRALLTMALWCAMLATVGALRLCGIIADRELLLLTLLFYVGDLVCVLIFCPFRLLMGGRCCTVCRIYNWDHFFMFSPLLLSRGFFGLSLAALSVVTILAWEITLLRHPERFWEGSNRALRCGACADKLCTQFCPKK